MTTLLPILSILLSICHGNIQTFVINVSQPGPLLVNEFVSNTIGSAIVMKWPSDYFENARVNTLAKGLLGSFIRFGGTPSDQTIYNANGTIPNDTYTMQSKLKHVIEPKWYTLNLTQFSQIANFAQRNGWQFIFGLNAQYRFNNNNSWDPTNAESLFDAIIKSKNDHIMYAFELGNEPDLYSNSNDQQKGYNNVSSTQLAHDYQLLFNLVKNTFQDHQMLVPKIFGPDIAYSMPYLKSFLTECKRSNPLNAITVHFYYGNDKVLNTTQDFINPKVLDKLYDYLGNVTNTVWENYNKEIAIIIGETSSTSGGGTHNLSTSFVSGFMMLDKLGLASIYGIFSVVRQEFCGGNYGLIGNGSYSEFLPNPNYWNQYLFKNLVGDKVLYVDGQMEHGRYIRVYAFCTRINDGYAVYNYPTGSVTVLILNLYNQSISIDLSINGSLHLMQQESYYDEYLLTSYPNVVNSRDIFLNGKLIEMPDENTLPILNGTRKVFGSSINLTALSYGFVVMVNANVDICQY